MTGEWCVHEPTQQVNWSRVNLGGRFESMKMGSLDQPILGRKGDDTRIDWGVIFI